MIENLDKEKLVKITLTLVGLIGAIAQKELRVIKTKELVRDEVFKYVKR